ncbi:MAG TPA: tetratricopeptide repeat protein, partial [Gemmataceae bacterium]|nr:tetratricopeptide repeat protein [Gemmataceae bacterium]
RGAEAVALVDDCLPRARRATGPRLADSRVQSVAAQVYDRNGLPAKAEPLRRAQVETAKQTYGPGSTQHVSSLGLLGDNLLRQRKWSAAEECCREVVAILENRAPPPPVVFVARSQLGSSLLGQKKYEEAEPLLRAGYEGMARRARAGESLNADRLPAVAEQLAALYAATKRPEEAAKWRAERAKYPFVAPPPRAKP